MRRKYRGFTLIEILIVVAIIGILATIVMLSLGGAQARSKYARVVSDMTSIAKAVDLYQIQNNNVYPADKGAGLAPDETGFSDYLPTWPIPPCKADADGAYKYDYNNTSAANPPAGRIGVVYGYFITGGGGVYYYRNIANSYTYAGAQAIDAVSQVTCKEYVPG